MHRTARKARVGAGLAAALLLAGAAVPAGAAGSASAEEPPPVLRSGGGVLGTVSTQVVTVVPLVGDLALPVKVGTAGAQADGEVRRASSHVADLGLLGTLGIVAITGAPTLTRLGIPMSQFTGALKLPAATAVDSRSTTDGEARPVFPEVPVGPISVGGGHQEAHAGDGTAVARTELGDMTVDLGVVTVELNGGVAQTTADATRVAATTTMGEMRFLTGGIEIGALRGLVWRYEQVLDQAPTSSFDIGSGRMGSFEMPLAAPAAGFEVAAALTQALAPVGLSLSLPQPRPDGGLTPLRVALEDSPGGGQFVRPVYSAALADAVNEAEAAIVAGVPESGLGLTVANVVLGAATGQGGVALELGGATGGIGRRPVEEFAYGGFPAPPRPALPSATSPTTSANARPSAALPPSTAPTAQPASQAPEAPSPVLSRLASVIADEAAPAVVVVLGGLGAALGLAALDRRRIAAIVAEVGAS